MPLKLNSTSGGSVTLQEPTTASNRTLTLPDATATLVADYSAITSVVSVTGAVTLGDTAFGKLHQCTGTSADYTVILPAVSGNSGKIISFQMSTALTKLVTIDGNGSETIDGATTRVMWAGETAVLYCDGTAWTKVGGKTIPMIAGQSVSATQSVATATATKKTLGSSIASNCPASMNDTANSKIVIARASSYQIQYGSRIQNVSTGSSTESMLYVNGGEIAITFAYFPSAGYYPNASCTYGRTCSVNDYFELYVRQYTGSNQTYGNYGDNLLIVTEVPKW